jgi:hypothetical protein
VNAVPLRTFVRRLLIGGLIAAATAAAFVAEAQAQAQVQATAVLTTTGLAVGQLRDVQFGSVVPGTPVTINPRSSAAAGAFEIQGTQNAEVAVTMTLPAELSTGVWTMPLAFGANGACWRNVPGAGSCNFYDPATVLVARIRNQAYPNNNLWVNVGGTVTPSPTQHTGVYQGTIGMTVVYTGN